MAFFAVSEVVKATSFGKFPVKFPVSRENEQSTAPSALLRQPASPSSRESYRDVVRKPAVSGLVAIGARSLGAEFDKLKPEFIAAQPASGAARAAEGCMCWSK
jgi:hypothetical protein